MKVCIERLGINGEGVTKTTDGGCRNKICFVPYVLPGEVVDIDIIRDKKDYCYGKANKIISTVECRVDSPCQYFTECGGCDIQHIHKDMQIDFKTTKVKDTILKIANIDIDVLDTIRLNDFGYRNKMVFPIANHQKMPTISMFYPNTHNTIKIHKCLITNDKINDVLSLSIEYFQNSTFQGYDFKLKKGLLKYLVIRTGQDGILVTIVATKKVDLKDYFNVLKDKFSNVGLSMIISDSDDDILSGKYYHIDGMRSLSFNEFGIKYDIDNRGFLQVNDVAKHELYQVIINKINSDDVVVDAYSGAGLLSAIISKKCKFVTAIEINKSASMSAKNLAKTNNITNINFVCGDVKDNLGQALEIGKNQVVVLDPPRSGCDKIVLETILQNIQSVKKIIYVSCNPATLARDLNILKNNFDIESVQPIDMFPQTKHVETLVILERKE